MAKSKIEGLREKSQAVARKGLKDERSFPLPPRKAMKQAKKASKKLPYPVPPYPSASTLLLYRWASKEWEGLGRWKGVAAPIMALVALLTWEKESAIRERRWDELEFEATKQKAAEVYGAYGRRPRRRKPLGLIPLPGGKR